MKEGFPKHKLNPNWT